MLRARPRRAVMRMERIVPPRFIKVKDRLGEVGSRTVQGGQPIFDALQEKCEAAVALADRVNGESERMTEKLSDFFLITAPGFEDIAVHELRRWWPREPLDIEVERGGLRIKADLATGLAL